MPDEPRDEGTAGAAGGALVAAVVGGVGLAAQAALNVSVWIHRRRFHPGATESLPGRLDRLIAQAREISAWVSEAPNEPQAYRVVGGCHDDGDRRGRLLERGQRWPRGDNHVHLETDQLAGEAGKVLGLPFASTWLGYEMLPIHMAELAQSTQERLDG